jgi:hypothetical protein
MPKLTDTQLIILAAAAKRDDGSILPLPKKLKLEPDAASGIFEALIKKKLVAEQPATGAETSWRETGDGQRVILAITKAGLRAIGVDSPGEGALAGKTKPRGAAKPPCHPARPNSIRSRVTTTPRQRVTQPPSGGRARGPRAGTKQEQVIGLLRRPDGASIEEMAKAAGWQIHSVRGVISGALKKKLGLAIASEKVKGRGRIYRINDHG